MVKHKRETPGTDRYILELGKNTGKGREVADGKNVLLSKYSESEDSRERDNSLQ